MQFGRVTMSCCSMSMTDCRLVWMCGGTEGDAFREDMDNRCGDAGFRPERLDRVIMRQCYAERVTRQVAAAAICTQIGRKYTKSPAYRSTARGRTCRRFSNSQLATANKGFRAARQNAAQQQTRRPALPRGLVSLCEKV
jgi:hypothetical protein